MAWFSNPFASSSEDQENYSDGDEEEDHVDGQGVKEDLSQLTQTFKRQLWGVASFLAPPPQAKDLNNACVDDEVGGGQSEASIEAQHDDHLASMGLPEDLVDVDFDVFLDETLDDKPAKDEIHGNDHTQISAHRSLPHSSSPNVQPNVQQGLTGISRDLAELKGSVATGFSKILRAVREEIDHVETSKSYIGNASEDEDEDDVSQETSPRSTGAEKSQGLNMYLKPLFNNILLTGKGKDSGKRTDASSDDGDEDADSNNAQVSSLFRGISGFASSLISVNLNSAVGIADFEEKNSLQVVGITKEVLAFAQNISTHPETWLDFPFLLDDKIDDFEMSAAQKKHIHALEVACPGLSILKTKLCADCMTENRFWKIYFVLVHSRLNKTDTLLLSTPEIMQARAQLSQKLQDDKEQGGLMRNVANPSMEDLKIRPQTSGVHMDFAEEVQNKDVLASTVKLATSSFKGAEMEADHWLNEEPLPHIPSATPESRDEDDVSFSDLEEDDGKPTEDMGRSNSTQSFEWVQLNKTSSAENFDGLKIQGYTHGDAARQFPQSSSQASRKQGQSESSDWSAVEEDDAASSDSLPS